MSFCVKTDIIAGHRTIVKVVGRSVLLLDLSDSAGCTGQTGHGQNGDKGEKEQSDFHNGFFFIPVSLMKASSAAPPSMLRTQSVRMDTLEAGTSLRMLAVLSFTQ